METGSCSNCSHIDRSREEHLTGRLEGRYRYGCSYTKSGYIVGTVLDEDGLSLLTCPGYEGNRKKAVPDREPTQEYEEKLQLLKKVSTVVLPFYNEGLPMSILEGMASGKAIISTSVGAIPEVVGKENGILIEAGDRQALADALIRYCKDTELVKQMSANNVEKIRSRFSVGRMHIRLAEYYEECFSA